MNYKNIVIDLGYEIVIAMVESVINTNDLRCCEREERYALLLCIFVVRNGRYISQGRIKGWRWYSIISAETIAIGVIVNRDSFSNAYYLTVQSLHYKKHHYNAYHIITASFTVYQCLSASFYFNKYSDKLTMTCIIRLPNWYITKKHYSMHHITTRIVS